MTSIDLQQESTANALRKRQHGRYESPCEGKILRAVANASRLQVQRSVRIIVQ